MLMVVAWANACEATTTESTTATIARLTNDMMTPRTGLVIG
jgi:hypothetical protein